MSVNIYDGTNLTPIAGKTVPAPTPDYVDEQYNNSTTYSKGMTCIEGNVRYRYKNSTATSGHRPPDTTYWEELSVADQIKNVSSMVDLAHFTGTQTGGRLISGELTLSEALENFKTIIVCQYNGTTSYGTSFSTTPIDVSTLKYVFSQGWNRYFVPIGNAGKVAIEPSGSKYVLDAFPSDEGITGLVVLGFK